MTETEILNAYLTRGIATITLGAMVLLIYVLICWILKKPNRITVRGIFKTSFGYSIGYALVMGLSNIAGILGAILIAYLVMSKDASKHP